MDKGLSLILIGVRPKFYKPKNTYIFNLIKIQETNTGRSRRQVPN
jgi:hypothetical protein